MQHPILGRLVGDGVGGVDHEFAAQVRGAGLLERGISGRSLYGQNQMLAPVRYAREGPALDSRLRGELAQLGWRAAADPDLMSFGAESRCEYLADWAGAND